MNELELKQYESEHLTGERYGFAVVCISIKSAIILSLNGYCTTYDKTTFYLFGSNLMTNFKD